MEPMDVPSNINITSGKCSGDSTVLCRWFSIQGDFALQSTFGNIWGHFRLSPVGGGCISIDRVEAQDAAKCPTCTGQVHNEELSYPTVTETKWKNSVLCYGNAHNPHRNPMKWYYYYSSILDRGILERFNALEVK